MSMLGRSTYIQQRTAALSSDFPVVNPRRPIEITYSSFMDLVEQQKQQQQQQQEQQGGLTGIANKNKQKDVPTLDKIKIAPDRISFRLSKLDDNSSPPSKKYVMAYTRKVPAPPETLQYLRQHHMDFTAASATSKSTIAIYAFRSMLFALYGLFLWRMYQTMRGAGGGGGGGPGGGSDVPGKLLQDSSNKNNDRPLASFTDIQGIDNAKNEVMELVDTLRNPEKYAILGARAPTGLLLEGPPGTGKVRVVLLATGMP